MIRFVPPRPDAERPAGPRSTDIAGSRDAPRSGPSSRLGERIGRHPVMTVAAVTLAITILLFRLPLCPDVSWQLWIAHHIRAGARLYVDIVEVNPPLWFWMAIPVDAVADLLRIDPARALIATVALMVVLSLAATEPLIRHIPAGRRTGLLVFSAVAMLLLPAWMTGQREQLLLIASLPYIALAAARSEGRTVPSWLAIGIGVGAALGFALKHYFLIAPALLEVWLIWSRRRGWRPIRPETLSVAVVGGAYALAIAIATPDFLTTIVPLLRLSYGAFSNSSIVELLRPAQYVWIGSVVALAIHHRRIGRSTPFTMALLIATAGFGAAWAIQHKGWAYQAIATSGDLAIALAALLAETGRLPNPLLPAMLLTPIVLGWHGDAETDGFRATLAPLAAETRPGDVMGFVTTNPEIIFPLTSERKLRLSGRYYSYWMLKAIVRNERDGHDPRLAALGRAIVRDTVIDYRCVPPGRIVFTHTPRTFDILGFFLRDPAFQAVMTHYRRERWSDGIDVFRQVSPLPPIPPGTCRRGV